MADSEIRARARLVTRFEQVPLVDGNASRLGQVFLNLLVNAAQAIPEGHAADNEVSVTLRGALSGEVVVEVRDSGCGIPDEALGRIFDPFFTTKPIGVGTGLGLSICHGIVHAMRGRITVESTPGKGSAFSVVLPSAQAAREEASPLAARRANGPRGRVLVVDDERPLGDSLRLLLESEHDVVVTTRAAEALARIRAGETFDVVLCDLMMPEMSGIELYEKLSEIAPALPERIVFMTGGAFTPASRDFLQRVPNPQLEKPFDLDSLREAVRRAAARREGGHPRAS